MHDEFEDILDVSAFPGADWMYLAELVSLKFQNIVMQLINNVGFSAIRNFLKMK